MNVQLLSGHNKANHFKRHVSAVADEPTWCTASWKTCCKQRWMLGVINWWPN